jgi:RNA polymerase sigma-70 factor (ECF subfamily)
MLQSPYIAAFIIYQYRLHDSLPNQNYPVTARPYDSDPDFARRFSAGDEKAFRQVFDAQVNPLCYFAQKLIGRRQEAEDMVSTAFYKLWQRHEHFTSAPAIRSFLYTTVRNQCLDLIKHEEVVHSAQHHLAELPDEGGIEARMVQAELLQLIYTQVQSLPERYRRILEWTFIDELSTADIADRLGLTQTHVRVEKSRALVQLRAALREQQLWAAALALFAAWQRL